MRAAKLFVSALVTGTLLVLVACGSDEGEGGGISPDDLPNVILNSAEVAIGSPNTPTTQGDENSRAYGVEYEVPFDDIAVGEIACVTVALALYATTSGAEDAFGSVISGITELIASNTPTHYFERVSTHLLGDESDTFKTTADATVFCSEYSSVPTEAYTFYFRDADIIAKVDVYYLENGADLLEAIRFAELQLDKIEQRRGS